MQGVKRLDERQSLFFILPVHIPGIHLLQGCGVGQHGAAKVSGGRCGEDAAGKALLDQHGQLAAVVEMGMRENDGVDLLGLERKFGIQLFGFFSSALCHAAVQ